MMKGTQINRTLMTFNEVGFTSKAHGQTNEIHLSCLLFGSLNHALNGNLGNNRIRLDLDGLHSQKKLYKT